MKKKVLAMLLATTMVATAFAGCGSKTETTGEATGTEAGAEGEEAITATITVWSPQEDQSEDNGNWLKTECEAFAAEHPEWNLTFEYGVCAEGDAKTNVGTDPTAAADVYMFANDQIPDLLAANGIAELGGSTVDQIKSQNSDTMVNTVTYDGGVYGVPFTSNTWFMYYDKSVFTEDDVKNLDTMLEKGVVSFPLSNSWYIASFYVANGCTLFGTDGTDEAAGFDFSGDKAAAVTDYLVDLAANPNFKNDAEGSGIAGLADGSVNAIFSGSWDYDNVKEALGDNMGIAAAPTFTLDGKEAQMKAFAGSKAIGVNPNAEYPQVAVALAAYLGSADAQKAHLEMRNILPTDGSVDVSGNELAEAVAVVLDKASTVQPLVSTMGQYWTPAQTMGEELVNGSVTHDNAAEKTEAMNEAMNTSVVE
ncbi:MAG: extracellular solute-binding protein [Lachnospiraceae bacterium]|nr:extracellular solute-binding protein [Lachnospiraceae bacterium]MBQ1609217.1 extracellular solute-binding protein [Lachnospiraceae bacterium]MBQ1722034.1 extracellular solute-binding protein [Lachnospiraceae bacterium]MBQ2318015.1 extracellular solute-binding protein [Lachnospiraceae bacterium]MBQ2503962.1 extracellular solute-binding protein [Lachnospiraceae bacterium]